MNWLTLLTGLNPHDLTLLLLRVVLGGFFILARFRWLWDPSAPMVQHNGPGGTCYITADRFMPKWRHEHLRERLRTCGYSDNRFLAGTVAMVELAAALGVLLGALTFLAALGLVAVLVFATMCTAKEKVLRQGPVDCIDWVSDYLWLVEPLYLIVAMVLVLEGAGRYSVDFLLLKWVLP